MARIELVGNPKEIWEKRQEKLERENSERTNVWSFELKILKQEQAYFKRQLDKLQKKKEMAIDKKIADLSASSERADMAKVKQQVELKYQPQMEFLLQSLRKAIIEEQIHLK